MNHITLRKATAEDRAAVLAVEKKSTPGLQYLPFVYELFLQDERGEFSVAEMAGEIVACAKFSVLPDGSAWLETIRVVPERQGLGIGKRFYENYFAVAQREGVTTMRMYTGIKNAVSKGLAERFGFRLSETFYGTTYAVVGEAVVGETAVFEPVTDPIEAVALVMPHRELWHDYVVMNRTFYRFSPELCAHFARRGELFVERSTGSVLVAGARFMPEQALHVGLFAGDAAACLAFAVRLAHERGVARLHALCPSSAQTLYAALKTAVFKPEPAPFIVMEHCAG